MSLTTAALRQLVECGLTADQILAIAEANETGGGRSSNAERQARYRARKAEAVTDDVTRNVTPVTSPETPSLSPPPRTPPPHTHPREEISPARKGRPAKPALDDADPALNRVWDAANQTSRDRSGRPATASAIRAALEAGATVDAIEASVRSHCRATTDHAKGLHRIIEARLWRDHIARPSDPAKPPDPQVVAGRQLHFQKTGEWRPEWGLRPAPETQGRAA